MRLPFRSRENARLTEPVPRADHISPIVSLTSFPPRIATLHKTVRSLISQSVAPRHIYISLARPEFIGELADLPASLRNLLAQYPDVVRVYFSTENLRSYKKLIPVLSDFGEQEHIVTVDDDVIYPQDFLLSLVAGTAAFPGATVGSRGVLIQMAQGGGLTPYLSWPQAPLSVQSSRVFLTGRGGILYPPGSLAGATQRREFLSVAPTSDDVWFKMMSLQNGFESVRVGSGREYRASRADQSVGLFRHNNRVVDSRSPNDDAIVATAEAFAMDVNGLFGGQR